MSELKLDGKRNVTWARIKMRTGNVLHFIVNFISDQTLGPEPNTTLLNFYITKKTSQNCRKTTILTSQCKDQSQSGQSVQGGQVLESLYVFKIQSRQ